MAGWLDRLVLIRSRIIAEEPVGPRSKVLVTDHATRPLVLKFAYPGNVQYHRLTDDEASRLSQVLAEQTRKGSCP